jgi:transposase
MIGLPQNTRIWIAAGVTDMRSGFNSLAAKVQTVLEKDPYSGRKRIGRTVLDLIGTRRQSGSHYF